MFAWVVCGTVASNVSQLFREGLATRTKRTFAGAGSKSHGVTSLLVLGVRGRDADGLPGRVVCVTWVALDGLRPLLSSCSG